MQNVRLLWVLAALIACKKTAPPSAVTPPPDHTMALDAPLPTDASVRKGTLPNGLTYFIEKNDVPKNKAVLRLAVDTGSILEDDDQLGLAHFLEHMAFNGTKSFPSNDLIKYLEGIGSSFGPHVNAHTSFEETVYKLTVPADDAEVFDKSLQILEEWACCMTLDPAEIEKERGVVLEEWRTREGVQQRETEVSLHLSFHGSRYPDRLPIGTDASLKTFDPAVVQRFYKDWYRPDLMAVIVVGDVDVDAVEQQIRERFGGMATPESPRTRTEFDIPSHTEPLYAVFVDPEITQTSGWMMKQKDAPRIRTWGDLVQAEVTELALGALNERLSTLARAPQGPFLYLGAADFRMTPTEGGQQVSFAAKEGRVTEALRQAQIELRRFQAFGITEGELVRVKAELIANYDAYEREAADTESASHAGELVRHFLQGEYMPGTIPEAELGRKAIRSVALEQVNTWAASFLTGDSRSTMVTVPEKEGVTPPTVDELKEVEVEVAAVELEPPVDVETPSALVEVPDPGTITARGEQYSKLGFQDLQLSNGVRVYFKKTDFTKGEVVFQAFRKGGLSAVPDEGRQFAVSNMAEMARDASGLGPHDKAAVDRYLVGKTIAVGTSFNDHATWLTGSASADDLGTVLELAYAYHTAPAFTDEGVQRVQGLWADWLKNYFNDAERVFSDGWDVMTWPDDPRAPQLQLADLDLLNEQSAALIWKQSLGSPEEWTWVFAGDLPDDFEAQLQRWIGAIPNAEPGLTSVDRGHRRATGVQRKTIKAGSADRAHFRLEFHGALDDELADPEWRANFDAFGDILRVKLRETLREDMGGVYGVTAYSATWTEPDDGWRVRVDFLCDPARVEDLEKAVYDVIKRMQDDGVEASYVSAELNKNREAWNDQQERNLYWVEALADSLEEGIDPELVLRANAIDATLTAEKVQAFAKKYLSAPDHSTLILLPEE